MDYRLGDSKAGLNVMTKKTLWCTVRRASAKYNSYPHKTFFLSTKEKYLPLLAIKHWPSNIQ
jgi:hypothetical protein